MSHAQGEGHSLRSQGKTVFTMIRTQYEVLQRDPRMLRLILVAILLLGAAYRFMGLDWGESTHLHPDERFLTMVTTSLDWPKNVAGYFNTATSPLNPHNRGHGFYVYGTFPVFLTKFVGGLVGKSGYDGVDVVGRTLSSIFDLGGVLLIFLIGRRLYGRRQGLLASLLLALTALNIQNSHFYTVDNFTSFFVTLAFYFAVRVAQGEGWGSFLGLGVAYGFAVAGKMNSAGTVAHSAHPRRASPGSFQCHNGRPRCYRGNLHLSTGRTPGRPVSGGDSLVHNCDTGGPGAVMRVGDAVRVPRGAALCLPGTESI